MAGVKADQFTEVVKKTMTDGEVCDWVRQNAKQPDTVKAAHRERILNHPQPGNAEMEARLQQRKAAAGMGHRDEIKTFVDFIDADEKRL